MFTDYITELLARKKELLARKREELALQEAGRGDPLALFMVKEELLSVNDQLRRLTPGHCAGARKASGSTAALDRKAYQDWLHTEDGDDSRRRCLREALRCAGQALTPKQRAVFEAWRGGGTVEEIALDLQISKSTVSRTLKRAKERIRADAEARLRAVPLRKARLDLSEADTARAVLSVLSSRQAVYLYLYYGEWLSLRQIGALTGVDHASVYRTLCAALGSITRWLHCGAVLLDNADAIGDLAYQLYLAQGVDLDALPPEPRRSGEHWGRAALARRGRGTPPARALPEEVTARTPAGLTGLWGRRRRLDGGQAMGPLLRALLARCGSGPCTLVGRWLEKLFAYFTKRSKRK